MLIPSSSAPGILSYIFGKEFLLPGSCEVMFDGQNLTPGFHYLLDERHGLLFPDVAAIRFACPVADSVLTLVVHYQALPFTFRDSYRHNIPVCIIDTATGKTMAVSKPAEPFSLDDLFGSNLQKSGSLVRGFTVGSNRDLSLTSGLRMQMSGNLTQDLTVVAALTDENSPLQPEGTTRTIQEVDKVFVELRSSTVGATLGDFPVEFGGNEFAALQRKLQGAKGTLSLKEGDVSSEMTVVAVCKLASPSFNEEKCLSLPVICAEGLQIHFRRIQLDADGAAPQFNEYFINLLNRPCRPFRLER